jgi:hypothetical protein
VQRLGVDKIGFKKHIQSSFAVRRNLFLILEG